MSRLAQIYSSSLCMATRRHFTRSKRNVVSLTEIRKLHIYARSLVLFPDRNKSCHRIVNPCSHGVSDCVHHRICRVSASDFLDHKYGLQVPRRHFSAESYNKYFSPDVAPIGFAQKFLEEVHSTTGLPWWASIALSTIALRGIITLPLAVYSLHIMARVELLQPEIGKLSQELRREVAMAVKKFAWDAKYARFKYNSTMKKLIKDLYIRENCHPAKSSLVLWFQIPMWVCLSFALRNMSGAVPIASGDIEAAVLCPDLKTEGALWFPDLTMPDGTWILPILLGVTNLLNIEMHSLTAQQVSKFQKGMVFVMRLLSLVMVPIASVVPSGMCYYWMCSSVFGLAQSVVFKIPSVRRLLRLPKTPSESETPFADMYNAAKLKYVLRPKQKNS